MDDDIQIDLSEVSIFEQVGKGATAEVFRGDWNGREVAIKVIDLPGKTSMDPKQQEAFNREVAVMSKVKHPHLVEFLGIVMNAGPLRVVTEYCTGGSLFDLLHNEEETDLNWKQQLKMCSDIAQAMNYLHSFRPQIIHRDLKSLNLLLMGAVKSLATMPHVKVSDFGLARMIDPGDQQKMTTDAGTFHWMAPEVATGRYTEKIDVFSYAMCLFEIIAREIPFEEEEAKEALKLIMSGCRPELEAIPPDRPQALEDLMVACWAQDPAKRPSFEQICGILNKIQV